MKNFSTVGLLISLIFVLFFIGGTGWPAAAAELFPTLTRESLQEKFSQSIENGQTANQAFDEIADFVFKEAPLGKKVCSSDGRRCLEVAGVHVSLDYSANGRDYPPIIKEVGDLSNSPEYTLINFSYIKVEHKKSSEFQAIYEMYISIALKDTAPEELVLTAEKTVLTPGERTAITAKLICGESLLKAKQITFQIQGPGELQPRDKQTDSSGLAQTTFTAKEEGTTTITATCHDEKLGDCQNSLKIETKEKAAWRGSLRYSFKADIPASEELPEFHLSTEINVPDVKLYWAPTPITSDSRTLRFSGSGQGSYSYSKTDERPDDYRETKNGSGGGSVEVTLAYPKGQNKGLLMVGHGGIIMEIEASYYEYVRDQSYKNNYKTIPDASSVWRVVEDSNPAPEIIAGKKRVSGPYNYGGIEGGFKVEEMEFNFKKVVLK